MSEVVITGVGAVSPFGVGADVLWNGLLEEHSCFGSHRIDVAHLPPIRACLCAAMPPFDLKQYLPDLPQRSLNLDSKAFLLAARVALDEARLDRGPTDRVGVCVGTRFAGLDDYVRFTLDGCVWGPQRVSPIQGPNTGFNAPASHTAIRLGFRGPNLTFSAGGVGALEAIAGAADILRRGRADAMIAGGVDLLSYARLGSLAAQGSVPDIPPRPYDAARARAVPGEGAVTLILEREDRALQRGARILARVGHVFRRFRPPSGQGVRTSGTAASSAPSPPRPGADAIFSSASGDRDVDAQEAHVLHELFGPSVSDVPVCAVKGATGDWEGASGALEALVAVRALLIGRLPRTAGFERPDPELPPLAVTRRTLEADLKSVFVLALDGQGHTVGMELQRA